MATFRKLPSGSWQARVRRKGESLLTNTFKTKALAEQWARSVETQIDRGTYVDRSEAESTTLGELIDRYLSEVSPSKKCYAQEVRRLTFLKRGLGHLIVASIQGKHIAAYRDKRLAEGRAAATVIREIGNLSHVFTVAIKDWGYPLLANPAQLIRKPSPAKGRDRSVNRR
ncbi:MAG: phage integrase [Methylomonas sp.]